MSALNLTSSVSVPLKNRVNFVALKAWVACGHGRQTLKWPEKMTGVIEEVFVHSSSRSAAFVPSLTIHTHTHTHSFTCFGLKTESVAVTMTEWRFLVCNVTFGSPVQVIEPRASSCMSR